METIAQQIFAVSEKYADKTAFIYYEKGLEKSTSYKQFMQLVKAFSQAIDEQNIPSHSIILLVLLWSYINSWRHWVHTNPI